MIMDQCRVVPMRLFATWEGDRASSNCVPRLCTLAVNRLTIFKTLEFELNTLVIAVKLQGYKRTLRSNDITVLPANGIIDIDLDISFTLQYSHYIKKKNNSLLVMVQRRKRYKNRPIPGGFKTLAVGMINLTEILQSSTLKELVLYSDLNDEDSNAPSTYHSRRHQPAVAKLYMHTLSSQPLEQDDSKLKEQQGEFTDEEEDDSTANDDGGSDSETIHAADEAGGAQQTTNARTKSGARGTATSTTRGRFANRQKNFKQKFVALLKKFKISEEEVLKAVDSELQQPTEQELQDLLEELDNYSNSEPEPDADTISVKSTPKPSLRPYFSSLNASKERLPTIENGAKDSEESKESGGDSQADIDTTDPEQSETMSPIGTVTTATTLMPMQSRAATASANVNVSGTSNSGVPVPKVHYNVTAGEKEQSKSQFNRPSQARNSDKKKKLLGNRQTSADVGAPIGTDTKHMSMLERLHATSSSSYKLRSGKEISLISGFTFPTPLAHQPVNDQLASVLPPDETGVVPDVIGLVSALDVHCSGLVQALREKLSLRLIVVSSQNDVKTVIGAILNRIQKYCNTNVFQAQNAVKLVLIGADRFFAHFLKSYTELLAQKSNEWLHFFRVFVVGPTWSIICRCMSAFDHAYAGAFGDNLWRDWWNKTDMSPQDITEIINRVTRYLNGAKVILPLPIAEAMLQLKDKGDGEQMSNIFVPFVIEVRRAAGEAFGMPESLQFDSPSSSCATSAGPMSASSGLSSSPPSSSTAISSIASPRPSSSTVGESGVVCTVASHNSPPGSPHTIERATMPPSLSPIEAQDLQIEYWTTGLSQNTGQTFGSGQKRELSSNAIVTSTGVGFASGGSAGGSNMGPTKYSLKTAFKSLIITRLPPNPSLLLGDMPSVPALAVQFIKEKKTDKVLQKLGMKNKDKIESEQKSQSVDGISRMVCSAKQHATVKLYIDGVEWTNVKCFQISAQWQTHVKFLPITLFHIDA